MAITLVNIEYKNLAFKENKKIWTMTNDTGYIIATYLKENETYKLTLRIDKGFRTDGASVPSMFTWFLPKWDNKNMKFNCSAILHDVLYTTKGNNNKFSREECDDFFRGGVRCAGYSRFKAGVADKCIEWFASSPEHWGSDDLNNLACKTFGISIRKI